MFSKSILLSTEESIDIKKILLNKTSMTKRDFNEDETKFKFLEFLARITDGNKDLEHLYRMAHSTPADKSATYHGLSCTNRKDILVISLGVVDNNGHFLEPFKLLAQKSILCEDGLYFLRFTDPEISKILKENGIVVSQATNVSNTLPVPRPK